MRPRGGAPNGVQPSRTASWRNPTTLFGDDDGSMWDHWLFDETGSSVAAMNVKGVPHRGAKVATTEELQTHRTRNVELTQQYFRRSKKGGAPKSTSTLAAAATRALSPPRRGAAATFVPQDFNGISTQEKTKYFGLEGRSALYTMTKSLQMDREATAKRWSADAITRRERMAAASAPIDDGDVDAMLRRAEASFRTTLGVGGDANGDANGARDADRAPKRAAARAARPPIEWDADDVDDEREFSNDEFEDVNAAEKTKAGAAPSPPSASLTVDTATHVRPAPGHPTIDLIAQNKFQRAARKLRATRAMRRPTSPREVYLTRCLDERIVPEGGTVIRSTQISELMGGPLHYNRAHYSLGNVKLIPALESIVPQMPCLQFVNLRDNRLDGKGCDAAFDAMAQLPRLRTFDLSENDCSRCEPSSFLEMIRKATLLGELVLSKAKLTPAYVVTLASELSFCVALRSLDLSYNPLAIGGQRDTDSRVGKLNAGDGESDGTIDASEATPAQARLHAAQVLGAALGDADCGLRHVDLSHNELTGVGAGAIALALATNNSLHTLDLSHNHFGETPCPIGTGAAPGTGNRGGRSDTKALRVAKFHDSSATGEEFGRVYDAAIVLGSALAQNKTLRSLSLVKNKVTALGAVALANAVFVHPNLRALDLSCNPLGLVGMRTLLRALATKQMTEFDSLWEQIESDPSSDMSEDWKSSDEEYFESAAADVAERVCRALHSHGIYVISDAFILLDENRDGILTRREFVAGLLGAGLTDLQDYELQLLFEVLDRDGP